MNCNEPFLKGTSQTFYSYFFPEVCQHIHNSFFNQTFDIIYASNASFIHLYGTMHTRCQLQTICLRKGTDVPF